MPALPGLLRADDNPSGGGDAAGLPPLERAEILDAPRRRGAPARLTGRQKAAIVVRLLMGEGVQLPLSRLPDHMQTALTQQIGEMRIVDRDTLLSVIEDFVSELERVGLTFPGGIEGALTLLDGQLSPTAASRLRRLASAGGRADPWDRLAGVEAVKLLPVLEEESLEVGAVILSKLDVGRAAALLERLPGDRARRLTHAMSRTGAVEPETVRRIGIALAQQFESLAPPAFETGVVERVGAILNSSPAATRDDVLTGLDETDPEFAEEVRKAIFTFANIPQRLAARDVPRVLRAVPADVMLKALVAAPAAGPGNAAVPEFLLSNITQRMAEGLKAEIAEHPPVATRAGEEAMGEVVAVIRRMEAEEGLILRTPDSAE
ncbi:MAG: flagellar motor switch protein FliG [Alkalilacustris sp.]